MSPIIDLQRRLAEVGRLRMGHQVPYERNGETKHRAAKLEHWRLTSRDKTRLEAAAELYGGTVQPWQGRVGEYELFTETAELAILLLPGQTLSQWRETWNAGGCVRRCDGEREMLTDSPCICDTEAGERTCKPTTRLSVMLPDVPGLGCWRMESHGYYAAVELSATAAMLEQATVLGQLLPARLRIVQRSKVEGGKTTRYAVPVIDIDTTPRHALSIGQNGERVPLAYTPTARELFAVTVDEGLAGAERAGERKAITAKSAAPIPPADDFDFGAAVPVQEEAAALPAAGSVPSAPVSEVPAAAALDAGAEPSSRYPKYKVKADVLVTRLREGGHITTEQLWRAMGRDPQPDTQGELHWSTLRDQLTRDEVSELIDRLSKLEERVKESPFKIPESAAQ